MLFELGSVLENSAMAVPSVRRARQPGTKREPNAEAARDVFASYTRHVAVADKDILELGPGERFEVLEMAADDGARRCRALEIGQRRALRSVPRIEVALYDGRHMPFAERSFDIVWSTDVLEHVGDPAVTLRESARVLRDGGWFLAKIDLRDHRFFDREERWLECLRYSERLWTAMSSRRSCYVNRLRASDWRTLLVQHGFDVVHSRELRSERLRELHATGPIRRGGALLSIDDASIFRLEVAAIKRGGTSP